MAPFVNLTHPIHTNIFDPGQGLRFISQLIDDPWNSNIGKKFHHKDVLTTPDFDVRETRSAYFLEANFAGIGRTSDIKMEWVGGRTLVIDAHVPRLDLKETWGVDVDAEQEQNNHDHGKESGNHTPVRAFQQQGPPEEEQQHNQRASTDTEPQKEHHHLHKEEAEHEKKHEPLPAVREWLSERHCGDMQRSFTFPQEVDVEDVKAKLRSGLLMIMVPKVHKTESRKKVAIVSED